ncbi:MAG TPA: sigma-70 family RNA polymerase sigma factor [Myxococcales bacterium]|jgi:RNA polymerase sigma factor (sigma-70 family)
MEVYREYSRAVYGLLKDGFTYESGGKALVFRGFTLPWAREEAVQEIFARAFRPAARLAYDGIRPYRNYLLTIARNHVLDLVRRQGREVLVAELPDGGQTPDLVSSADLDAKELQAHLEGFIAALEPFERALFEARFRSGQTIAQAAQALGVTRHRIKYTEARLQKRFFLRMKELGYFQGFAYGKGGLRKVTLLALLAGAA